MRPILSVNHVAWILGVPKERLFEVAGEIDKHYRHDALMQGSKSRQLKIPKQELMSIQRRIRERILAPIALSENAHGGVKGRSPRSNADQHLGQQSIATCDVRNFFPSVRHSMVYRMFRHRMGFGQQVASLLTRLVTFDAQLPQGSPTSTAVANLLMTPIDEVLSDRAKECGIRYTRYVDDMTFSGVDPAALINQAGRLLSEFGLRQHRKQSRLGSKSKLRIVPLSRAQEVTGLVVNSRRGPSISRARREEIRKAILNVRHLPGGPLRHKAISSMRGKIAYVRQFNPGAADRMTALLKCVSAE